MANGKWQIVMANRKDLAINSEQQIVNGKTGSKIRGGSHLSLPVAEHR
jgi:hypothetical protein